MESYLKRFQISSLLLLFIKIISYTEAENNNACKRVEDYATMIVNNNCFYNPDIFSEVIEIVERNSYKGETLYTITNDGYNLTIYRIFPREGTDNTNKPPIFIQPGLLSNCRPFVDKGNRSLAFALADLGHEVFLGNIRGSTYSKENIYFDTSSDEFWNYTIDTIANQDVPSQVEFIANLTGSKLLYIGHSLGTTVFFMWASENPEKAAELIQGMIALAPIAYFRRNYQIYLATPIAYFLEIIQVKKLAYHENFIHHLTNILCPAFPRICRGIQFFTLGESVQFLPEDLLLFYNSWPSTVSVKELLQYAQMHNSDKFQKFSYGKIKNMEIYQSESPHLYDLGRITNDVYLFYGSRDLYASETPVQRLYNELGSAKKHIQSVPKDNPAFAFDHLDFVYAAGLKEFLYNDMFPIISSYRKETLL